MPTLRGSELEQREPEMEQIAGRCREKMKDLRTPPAKHRHTELSPVPGASHSSFPGLGLSKAGGKLGHCQATVTVTVQTCPGTGLSEQPAASSAAAGCSATVRPSKVMEVPPQSCWDNEQGITIPQFSGFTNFYPSKDLNLF